jgi:hypothetical protein
MPSFDHTIDQEGWHAKLVHILDKQLDEPYHDHKINGQPLIGFSE